MSQSDGYLRTFVDELDYVVFGVGMGVAAFAVLGFILWQQRTATLMWDINDFLWESLSWAYLLIMFILVLVVFFLILGPWGNIKLGDENETPEFSFSAYFAMLYSAAIAAGIVFWGPAEAIFHYDSVPPLVGAEPQSTEAAVGALQYTFFHWGLSAWSAYVVMAIPIAYFAYRHDAPLRISTVIAPWIGLDNLESPAAKLIDILAVFATIGGVATTLGFVGSQFLTGLEYQYGVELGDMGTVIVITGLTIAFTVSVALGVERGIRRISYFNMGLFALLTFAAFVLGPTVYIMSVGTEALGAYLNNFVSMSLFTDPSGVNDDFYWVGGWTVFYWAWWFSWTPFVGLFIARISRGRTIRQVALTGVIASTAVTIPWFATMGGTAIYMQNNGLADVLSVVDQYGEAGAGYPIFEAMPLGGLLVLLFLLLITTFFVTSADSSTLALGMLTTGGSERPSTINRVMWGALMGALASILMVVGGVDALQAASIITGGPFAIVTLIAVGAMITAFGELRPVLVRHEEPGASIRGTSVEDDD